MIFTGGFNKDLAPWKEGEKRTCRFVFIGRNLKPDELKKRFEGCKAKTNLRFKVGDLVLANCAEGWLKGKIIRLWDEGNPYRIELEDAERTNVWGFADHPKVVKARE